MNFKLKKDQKYIFATDLDGTFLTNFVSSMHIDSFEAVEKIKAEGHYFVIATGRAWWWTETLYEQLNLTDASIHFSGAQVHHPKNDIEFDELRVSMPIELIKKLIKTFDLTNRSEGWQAVGRKKHGFFSKGDSEEKLNFNCYELVINYNPSKVDMEIEKKAFEKLIGNKYIVRHWKMSHTPGLKQEQLILSPKGTSKAVGLEMLAEYYGIPRENVIYFGDNVNDIEALDWAGYSYCPSNAKDIAKKHANEILELTNDQGAVPKQIIKLLNEVKTNG